METNNKNLQRYLNLWNYFENLLLKKQLNLSSFSKEWEKHNTIETINDYKVFYSKIKKQQQRKKTRKSVQTSSISQIEEYIKFLDTDFVIEEMRDDESYEHWFD